LHREPLKPVGPVLLPLFEEDGGARGSPNAFPRSTMISSGQEIWRNSLCRTKAIFADGCGYLTSVTTMEF
jgi:hypothetical protein